jgi:hypothetical protein
MSALAAESRGKLRRPSVKFQHRALAGKPNDLNILPGNAVAQAGSNGLHAGFLGSKAGRQALSGIGLARTVPDLRGSEYTPQKTVAKALYGSLNAIHFDDVNSRPYNHLGLIAKVSYRWLRVSNRGLN